ncbi:MAG: PAS domain S-box protein, partial [Chloroflexi bacterium]|nr:PAS domain S-box protein [Chloroflexota bacterium]
LEAGDFDLVITDYQLGWTDGLAVLRAVKARSPDYPVIMLTGTDSEEIAAEAMKARLDVYVTKSPQHFAFLPAVVRSIQEQLQKRQVMKQAETLYHNLYERVPVGLYRTTPTGEILDANPALMEMLGYPDRESLLAVNVEDIFVAPEDRRQWQALMEREGIARGFEMQLRRRDGTVIWVRDSARAVRDADGRALYYEGSLEDITEHKQRERELKAIVTVSATLRTAPTRADMLPVILDQLCALLEAEGAALAMRDLDSGESVIELARGGWANWTGVRLPPGEGVGGHVIATGQPYISANVQADPRFARQIETNGLRAVACIPLIALEQTIGALWVGRKTRIADEELRLLTAIGDIAANAIRRATLHEQTAQLYKQLESRESFITRILESIPSSLVVIDRNLRVVSVNRNFLEKTRREARVTLGHKIEEVFPQALVEYTRLDQKVRQVFRTGQPVEGGKVAYRAPGLPSRIYYYRLIPLKVADEAENVMLLMDDITDREHLGEEVRRAERHLASVVECASDLVVSLDPQGRIVTWNRAAERISGLKAEQVEGRSLDYLCAAEQQPVMAKMLRGLIRGAGVQNIEVKLLTANGQEVPIAWSCSPMRDDAGGMVGIVAVGRDLTEQRRMEAQLVQSAKMASLGVMAGGIAHELRNPLGIISASAQLLLERPDDAQLRSQCAQKIHAATQRASVIIENLLKFGRPVDQQMREVDLHAVLEETLALLAHQVTLQEVTLRKEFQPDLPRAHGNPQVLQQVFTNLILNACNAMPQGGTLTVATRATEIGRVEIRFSDTGRGIPPEHLPKIFDPFFTTMPVGKGIGLGLSISYSIIQQHQGTIEVESQVGQGTTFTVRLPVTADGR